MLMRIAFALGLIGALAAGANPALGQEEIYVITGNVKIEQELRFETN